MEYLQVFDSNGKALNEKVSRQDKMTLPDDKYFMVSVIFIQNSEGKFLLQKTSKDRGSCIATTGGHVSLGDDGLKTIIKECSEELGLSVLEEELIFISSSLFKKGIIETYYLKKDLNINSLVLQKSEVDGVDWYSINDINELIKENKFRDGNIKPFNDVINYLQK